MGRRENGTGSVGQRKDGLWVGRVDAGFTSNGKRRRATVSAKTEAQCKAKLRALIKQLDGEGPSTADKRMTVKRYADEWLAVKVTKLSPKGYNAAASPIRKWIVPTIGHRRLAELTPAHVRQVERAQRGAGLKGSTCAATQRTLMNMLASARRDGHRVADAVMEAEKPTTSPSDRQALPLEEVLRILALAEQKPMGLRWLMAILYGWRQNEVLGLTKDAIEPDGSRVWLDWQLQALPYRIPRDRSSGFRVPDEHESKHLVDAWHLVRPKSKAGRRSAPVPEEMRAPLAAYLATIDNPYGLLFPDHRGRPRPDKMDRAEWWAMQDELGIIHPTRLRKDDDGNKVPAGYHVHECRNVAASRLREVGADDVAITNLMGHTSVQTSRIYFTVTDGSQEAVVSSVYGGLVKRDD